MRETGDFKMFEKGSNSRPLFLNPESYHNIYHLNCCAYFSAMVAKSNRGFFIFRSKRGKIPAAALREYLYYAGKENGRPDGNPDGQCAKRETSSAR